MSSSTRAALGGAVAGERLKEAKEAFEGAVRQEREIEADYDAWKLLLETLKEADAAQASNLGQALAPAIAKGLQELTQLSCREAIAPTIDDDPDLRRQRDLLLSVSGVGGTLAGVVLAELPGPNMLRSVPR